MKSRKTLKIVVALLLVATGVAPAAQAALTGISNGGIKSTTTDQVNFYLYDLDKSRNATLSADTLSFLLPPNRPAPSLEYRINNSGWEGFNGPLSIDYGNTDLVKISFRLDPNENNDNIRSFPTGDVTFQGYDAANSNDAGLELFHALYVVWDFHHHAAVTFSSSDDPVTPNAPIPATALLLFTGLIGIIGFRRRVNNS